MKIKQSETIVIKRSQINFAPYNPRKKDPKVVEALKKNFKRVGFLGGIQWNSTTGNLLGGHKRVEAMDLIFNYSDGTNDYDIKVESIALDEKTEKEQNIFLNNKRVQGADDYELLAQILPEIDIDFTGLENYDLEIISSIVPDFDFGSNKEMQDDIKSINPNKGNKEKIKEIKKSIKSDIGDTHKSFYFCVTFDDYMSKAEFLEGLGINGDDIYITSQKFLEKLKEN